MREKVVPLYQQIEEDIKSRIENGVYSTREKIPSETELRKKYSVSRITIRRAIDDLCSDGYLVKMQGRGTFVNLPHINRKITEYNFVESFTKTCKNNGMKASGRLICHKIVPMQEDEQNFLKLPNGALLLYIQRVRSADGLPILIENVFLPYEEYKDILKLDLDSISLFDSIEKMTGKRPVGTKRRTIAIMRASVEQAKLLDVSIGEPMFYVNVYFVDSNKNPVCIVREYCVGSRYVFNL